MTLVHPPDDSILISMMICVCLFSRLFHSASKPAVGKGRGDRWPDAAFLCLLQEPEQGVL